MRTVFIFLIALTAAACAAPERTNTLSPDQAASLRINGVDVITEDAFFGARAPQFKPRLEADLERALTAAFSDRISPEGPTLVVDVTRMVVVDSGSTAFGFDQSTLTGQAELQPAEGAPIARYDIASRSGVSGGNLLIAAAVAATQSVEGYYASLVERFAETAKAKITE